MTHISDGFLGLLFSISCLLDRILHFTLDLDEVSLQLLLGVDEAATLRLLSVCSSAALSSSISASIRAFLRSTMLFLGFSCLAVGVAQLNLHLVEGIIPAPDLGIQIALHGVHHSLAVPLDLVDLLVFLCKFSVNFTLDLEVCCSAFFPPATAIVANISCLLDRILHFTLDLDEFSLQLLLGVDEAECSSPTRSLASTSSCSATLRLLSVCSSAALSSSISASIRAFLRSTMATCSLMSSWPLKASSRASFLLLISASKVLCMESITLWLFLLIWSISSSFSASFLSISFFTWTVDFVFLGLQVIEGLLMGLLEGFLLFAQLCNDPDTFQHTVTPQLVDDQEVLHETLNSTKYIDVIDDEDLARISVTGGELDGLKTVWSAEQRHWLRQRPAQALFFQEDPTRENLGDRHSKDS
ncbi:hypothetical protein EYF80_005330 [Liparis tanakae]|uniref:Uncharacterized protein n=1 Tax=Liparis tanakae TaxID=230148 RepID=A0A4Z2J2V4_9TELE|nr:hypothetical protein EYF80_005330 [Liparis tanakae]